MSKLGLMVAMATMLSATNSGFSGGISTQKRQVTPDYKRKKCKSCKSYNYGAGYGKCAYPNNQACENYIKRKK